jgi:hypothetical protein
MGLRYCALHVPAGSPDSRVTSRRNSPCVKIEKGMSLSGYVDTRIKGMAELGRISVRVVVGGIVHSVSSSATAGDSPDHGDAPQYWILASRE